MIIVVGNHGSGAAKTRLTGAEGRHMKAPGTSAATCRTVKLNWENIPFPVKARVRTVRNRSHLSEVAGIGAIFTPIHVQPRWGYVALGRENGEIHSLAVGKGERAALHAGPGGVLGIHLQRRRIHHVVHIVIAV